MGKWEMGYHQANRAPQSTNQIRKLGVCVSESENVCVCVCVRVACKLSGALMAVMFQEVVDCRGSGITGTQREAFPGLCVLSSERESAGCRGG